MYFLIITISSCLSFILLSILVASEGGSALGNVHSFVHLSRRVVQSHFGDALLVHLLHALLDARHALVAELVAAQSHAEVVWGDLQAALDVLLGHVVHLIQADVNVFELGVHQQEPVRHLGAVLVLRDFALEGIEQRHNLLRLLTRLQFLVLLQDSIALLELKLVGGHILSREGLSAEALQQGLHISRRQVVLGKANVFEIAVLLKDLFEASANIGARKVIMAQVDHFQRFVLLGAGLGAEVLSDLSQVVVIET